MNQEMKPLERELRFTKVYQNNINQHKAIREMECLKEQIPQGFISIKKESDIFVGRISIAQVGFYPIFGGSEGLDKTAYCINQEACEELLYKMRSEGQQEEDYLAEIEDMIKFWAKENTVTKIRAKMSPELNQSITEDNYNTEIGACYPLYRIAGIHLDAKKLFRYGLNGLIQLIRDKSTENLTEQAESQPLYTAMIGSLELMKEVCQLYVEEMDRLCLVCEDANRIQELNQMKQSLINIKEDKPSTLHEAIQLLILYMLASGTREIGRLDDYLGEFYRKDLEAGRICRDDAVRYVVNFFDRIEEEFSRDTRAIIGGFGRDNESEADEFALVVLDALDLRPFHYLPQVSLRYYKSMDQRLYDRSLDILAKGRTFPILYNDDVNITSVQKAMGVSEETAKQYAFFGCGEYMLACKSIGTPNALINVAKVLEVTLHNGIDPMTGKLIGLRTGEMTEDITFTEIMERFHEQVNHFCDMAGSIQEVVYDGCNDESAFLLVSILYDDCINRGKALFDGGIEHLGGTVETYGNVTAADSLSGIREVVYEQKQFTITRLIEALEANFEGFEEVQQALLNAEKFGNDYEKADQIAVAVHEMVCNGIKRQNQRTRMDSLLVVVINNNMNISMGRCTGATPDGRKAYEYLSNGNNPYNGRDKEGITALMKSLTKMDTSIHAGANQNFKFNTDLFKQKDKIKMLLGGYFALGGQQTNISVINQKDLEEAMKYPERYENLLVRVGGFTSRFIYLDDKTKHEVLARTAY